jgi:hypothetical protein
MSLPLTEEQKAVVRCEAPIIVINAFAGKRREFRLTPGQGDFGVATRHFKPSGASPRQ